MGYVRRLINLEDLNLGIISFPVYIPVPDGKQADLPADSTGVKWTSSLKFKVSKRHLKAVRLRASWSSSYDDSVIKIALKDLGTGNDVVSVSGNSGADQENETTDLSNVTDEGLLQVYAEVTTASATSGAVFSIDYVIIELIYSVR